MDNPLLEAFFATLEAARRSGFEPPALRKLRDSSAELAELGHGREVLEAWRSLPGLHDVGAPVFREYSRLCASLSWYEEDALAGAREMLRSDCDDRPAREESLFFLARFDGPSLPLTMELRKLFETSAAPKIGSALLIADYLLTLGETGILLDFYGENQEMLEGHIGESPAVAYAYLNSGLTDRRHHGSRLAEETLSSAEAVRRSEIWDRIGDCSRSLAIVGNAAGEAGRRRGEEIDAHDIVIRFNNYSIEPPYDQDYGRKVDIVCDAPGIFIRGFLQPRPQSGSPDSFIIGAEWLHRWSLVRRLLSRGNSVALFSAQQHRELRRLLRRPPSTGLLMCWVAAKLRDAKRPFAHYGFSFTDHVGASYHYHEKARPWFAHDWSAEKRLFQEIAGGGPAA